MQQELIKMLEKVTEHIVICNNYDQRFSSTSYGANILKEAEALVEKAKNSAKEPAVPMSESQRADMICAVAAICTGTSSRTVAATAIEWVERYYGITTTAATPPQQVTCGNGCSCLVQCGDTYAHAGLPSPKEPVTLTIEEANAIKLTSWTDEENYGAKFCEGFNAGVNAVIDALHKKG